MAADRSGTSKLKEGITADDLVGGTPSPRSRRSTPAASNNGGDDDEMDEEDEEDDDDDEDGEEDDFLARELGEDWG